MFKLPALFRVVPLSAWSLTLILAVAGCDWGGPRPNTEGRNYLSEESRAAGSLSNATLALNASAPPLQGATGRVITDNDTAFETRIELIRNARQSLDIAYYIYSDDYSSSLFSRELIAAARRGVRVRVLLDYFSNYIRLDLLRMLEREGNRGSGSLEVRLYGRPTDHIIADAIYLTTSCARVGQTNDLEACAAAKREYVARLMTQATGSTPEGRSSNFNSGGSGVFLSGLYGKDAGFMAHSILNQQQIDLSAFKSHTPKTPQQKEEALRSAIKGAKVYWRARAGNDRTFQRLSAELQLGLAFSLFGDTLNPIYDALSAYLPIQQLEDTETDLRDWDFLTEFLHHKLILADSQHLMIGGRNIEDSYHMRRHPLLEHYRFMDTDTLIETAAPKPELEDTFEGLWRFRAMTAGLDEVVRHAPNDFLMATRAADAACAEAGSDLAPDDVDGCRDTAFSEAFSAQTRIAEAHRNMLVRAERYRTDYRPRTTPTRDPSFPLGPQALVFYLENLPFERVEAGIRPSRIYGSVNDEEGRHGKHIHKIWLAGLRNSCQVATATQPQTVLLNSAYLLPPSNMLRQLREMLDGTLDCRHVTLKIFTNSPRTTDLSIINFFARYATKPLADFARSGADRQRQAQIDYFELRSQGTEPKVSDLSLHSKVSVLGPDLLIGSANMDVRSYMLDTNNGLYIRQAPGLVADYLTWMNANLRDPDLVQIKTGWLQRTTLDAMLTRDLELLETYLAEKLSGTKFGESLPLPPLIDEIEKLLRRVHDLSADIVYRSPDTREAERRYNALLKLL